MTTYIINSNVNIEVYPNMLKYQELKQIKIFLLDKILFCFRVYNHPFIYGNIFLNINF